MICILHRVLRVANMLLLSIVDGTEFRSSRPDEHGTEIVKSFEKQKLSLCCGSLQPFYDENWKELQEFLS